MTILPIIFGAVISGYMFFSRNPNRSIPEGDNIVSPADGTVVDISKNKIEIFIGIMDVHVQRAPQSGIISNIIGKNKEYNLIELDTQLGYVTIERWAGNLAKTVTTDVNIGDYINKGNTIGRILLGSHTAITIPPGLTIKVTKGQHVIAGETIIAD
jgi:phosphatidylserine decarboxylase